MTQVLASSGNGLQKDFLLAVRHGNKAELERLLETMHGTINVNLYDTEGQTALHQSCEDGNFELVKLLVKFGADVKLANRDGWNALHIAAFMGHQDIALYLISANRNIKRQLVQASGNQTVYTAQTWFKSSLSPFPLLLSCLLPSNRLYRLQNTMTTCLSLTEELLTQGILCLTKSEFIHLIIIIFFPTSGGLTTSGTSMQYPQI